MTKSDDVPDQPASAAPRVGVPRCPICRAPTQQAIRPFCSTRCSDIDLGRWISGAYAIAGGSADTDEDGDGAVHPASPPDPDDD